VLPNGSAGLPRRYVPRNDKGGEGSIHGLGMTLIMLSLRDLQVVAIQSEA
jgi:hypothetical protein